MRTTITAFVLAASLGAGACASTPEVEPAARTAPAPELAVNNYNWLDVNVYALVAGSYERLGTVTASGSADLELPRSVLVRSDAVQFLLEPIGSTQSHLTQPVQIFGATRIRLQIENQLSQSTVTVR